MYWKITKDHLWEEGDSLPSRKGMVHHEYNESNPPVDLLEVRLRDDDLELYYEAVADDEALENLFFWAQRDAGVTLLEVKDENGKWNPEVG